ncbi:MAG TPA: lasso peptide biosynthesis B2 protein [Gemmatimonadaceae bacterium]|nr:lasso peptide biosynthesis B2 protein [Gemmatimonadaceae bacterium]
MIALVARKLRAGADVLRAAVAVTRARRTVRTSPIGGLVDSAAVLSHGEGRRLSASLRVSGERWGAAVDRVLRWTPGDSACLVRASALRDLLAQSGRPDATVRIGVRRNTGGFEAHAWVELDGTPIAEPVSLRGAFASLDGVTLR